ncbi:hypothetical protein ACFL35_05675 [Candidatus Riflebacteria bacterium]
MSFQTLFFVTFAIVFTLDVISHSFFKNRAIEEASRASRLFNTEYQDPLKPEGFSWTLLFFLFVFWIAASVSFSYSVWFSASLLLCCGFCFGLNIKHIFGLKIFSRFLSIALLIFFVYGTVQQFEYDKLNAKRWKEAMQAYKKKQEKLAEVEDKFVEKVRQHKPGPWTAGRGVTEFSYGPMLAWLGIDPDISVDWSHELELEKRAASGRQIPITVALLNNTFADVPLTAIKQQESSEDPYLLWKVWITKKDSVESLIHWTAPVTFPNITFFPAQLIRASIDWDGRDQFKRLLKPGNYIAHLTVAGISSVNNYKTSDVELSIFDHGRIEKYTPSASSEWQHARDNWQRLSNGMREIRNNNLNWQFQQNRYRNW